MAEFVIPTLGADMTVGTLLSWMKKPGDAGKRGEIIAEVHPLEVVYFSASAAQCYSQPLSELAISSKQLALPVARSLRSLAVGIVNCQPSK